MEERERERERERETRRKGKQNEGRNEGGERGKFQSLTNDPLRIGYISANRFEKAAGDT